MYKTIPRYDISYAHWCKPLFVQQRLFPNAFLKPVGGD